MKKIVALGLSLGLCIVLFGCSTAKDEPKNTDTDPVANSNSEDVGEQSITGNVAGLSFSYTADPSWHEEQITDATFMYYLDGSELADGGVPLLVVDESYATKTVDTLADQYEYLKTDFLANSGGMEYSDLEESELNGQACVKANLIDSEGNKGKIMVFFTSPNTVGMLEYVAEESIYDSYIAAVEATMNSVAISTP